MPTVQMADDAAHAKAFGLLIRMGGIFWTKPVRRLVVGLAQLLALEQAGLLPKRMATRSAEVKAKDSRRRAH